ncbi:hypothetical protein KVV02_005461 [Mortierella alpina]|uniref:Sel1 repeat family protein n=1 Tax=Mortierella alpina TaxID=64518 RepID=A0A9P8D137_MORAP|nr:hypothetical protein KVV02_005461 [Mortierella alpina]
MSAPQHRTPDITSRTEAANKGNADAQLGLAYFEEEDVAKNLPKAAKWFRKAADQGLKDAQYKLDWMYFSDQGVPRDQSKTAKLFLKAGKQGHKQAQFNLGSMYLTGDGAQQSFSQPDRATLSLNLT